MTNWIFNFCENSQQWRAVTRENYNLLFNEYKNENVLRSTDINVLIKLINSTNGNIDKINKLLK